MLIAKEHCLKSLRSDWDQIVCDFLSSFAFRSMFLGWLLCDPARGQTRVDWPVIQVYPFTLSISNTVANSSHFYYSSTSQGKYYCSICTVLNCVKSDRSCQINGFIFYSSPIMLSTVDSRVRHLKICILFMYV